MKLIIRLITQRRKNNQEFIIVFFSIKNPKEKLPKNSKNVEFLQGSAIPNMHIPIDYLYPKIIS